VIAALARRLHQHRAMTVPRWWHDEHEQAWQRVHAVLHTEDAAVRYGVGARVHYGIAYPQWNDLIEAKLRDEWQSLGGSWDDARPGVLRGWDEVPALDRTENAA
jgi:hypothetical protein